MWSPDAPQGNEAAKVRWEIVPYTRGVGLDVGCNKWKAHPHFIGIDCGMSVYQSVDGADITWNCEDLSLFADEKLDFVFSSHVLEHIDDYQTALADWWRVIRPSGYLVLYLPHKDFYPNIGQDGANAEHKHDFLPDDIIEAMKSNGGWTLLKNETRSEGWEYSFLQVYQKRRDGKQWIPQPAEVQPKSACVVRYGGYGDMMQTSSVVAALKAKGYRVVMMTHTDAHKLMEHDPNIDGFVLQDKNQVSIDDLGEFWHTWKKKFDLWVNLSESVEATWLAIPRRTSHDWPQKVRAKYLTANYLEFMHELALCGDIKPRVRYYPSPENAAWAKFEREKMGGQVVMFALAGSSVHKYYPWMDNVIASILINHPEAKVVLTGEFSCKILEQGWENEPRVIKWAGETTIEQSLAFAQTVDCVFGPETGVMNAVCHEPHVGKVVLLSHSSRENLTKDWVNTVALEPEDCFCYPCHRLHYGWEFCTPVLDQDGEIFAATCAYNITPDRSYQAVRNILQQEF